MDRIKAYLRALRRDLWLRGLADDETIAEIEGHLRESVEQGIRLGLSADQAEQRTLGRFGSAKAIASSFEKERMNTMQNILLAVAVLAGLFSAYVDALPTWDDTGILVGSLLIVSGLLTLLGHHRPWLIALAVGIWIPLHDIYLSHDLRMLLVLLIPFVGAYAGWAVRIGIRKTFHPA